MLDDRGGAAAGSTRAGCSAPSAAIPDQVRDAWAAHPRSLDAARRASRGQRGGGAGHGRLGHRRRPGARHLVATGCACRSRSVRDYDLPAWVGPDDAGRRQLATAARPRRRSAPSGTALERRCPVAVITHRRADRARSPRAPACRCLTFPGGGQPRASVGYAMTLLAGLLERAGMLAHRRCRGRGGGRRGRRAVAALRRRTCRPRDNLAKQLAWSLLDRLPVIEASGFLAAGRAALEDAAQRERQVDRRLARSCPRRRTTRSSATRSPSRCATTTTSCSWPARSTIPATSCERRSRRAARWT